MSLPVQSQEYDIGRSEKMKREPQTSDNDVLVSQVRAFLAAAEDVDIDVETMEDLIQSLPPDFGSEIDLIGELELTYADSLDEDTNVNGHQLIKEIDTSVQYEIQGQGTSEISFSSCLIHCGAEQQQQIWTPQEIKDMVHHLKERG